MKNGGKHKIENRLRPARKRLNLEHKHVAYLLGHKSNDQISRYETDVRLPSLETALELEIILGVPVRLLFPDLYQRLRGTIRARAENNRALGGRLKNIFGDGLCPYAENLSAPAPSPEEFNKAHDHAIEMVNKVSARRNEYL